MATNRNPDGVRGAKQDPTRPPDGSGNTGHADAWELMARIGAILMVVVIIAMCTALAVELAVNWNPFGP